MTDTIYKIQNQDDTILSGATEKLLFNDTAVLTVGVAYITNFEHKKPKAVTGNQALGQGTVDQQPQGVLGEFYIIEGSIPFADGTLDSETDDQTNPVIQQLKDWEDALDTIPGIINHGMFGIELKSLKPYTLAPVSSGTTQVGLLWVNLDLKTNLALNLTKFVLTLKVDKGK